MVLRTRRRISPRTKRRYLAIRNFFRRTLGSISSQPELEINSSIAVNVTNLKRKTEGIEHQLDDVNKHCHYDVSFENISRKEIESAIPTEGDISSTKIQNHCSDKKLAERETELLYKTSESHFIKAEIKDSSNCLYDEPSNRVRRSLDAMNREKHDDSHLVHKTKSKMSRRDIYDDKCEACPGNLRKNRRQPNLENFSLYSSYVSLGDRSARVAAPAPERSGRHAHHRRRRHDRPEEHAIYPVQEEVKINHHKHKVKRNKSESPTRIQENRGKSKKNIVTPANEKLDQDFIADLIQRQYKPVRYFDTRSDCSQISFPVCRDNEFPKPKDVIYGSDMCSCCVTGRQRCARGPALGDMRSLCDTRLYSSRHRKRSRSRDQDADAYYDSNLYDVVPVKEKSSPKSRRKFVEDNMHYENLEVPPSPRSHRPRLNLQAQHYDESDGGPRPRPKRSRRNRSPYQQRRPECADSLTSEGSSDESASLKTTGIKPKPTKNAEVQEDMDTTATSFPCAGTGTDKTNTTLDDTLTKTDSNNDKTDKALCEIKDILQNFLQAIKKETPQCDRSNESKTDGKCDEDIQQQVSNTTPNVLQNSGHNEFAGYGVGACGLPAGAPYSPASPPPYLVNPCCYRVMPVCPMNCVQNGYLVDSPSYTQCQACMNSCTEPVTRQASNPKEVNEIDNLIREIYKYVAHNPNMRKNESAENRWREIVETRAKNLKSRGVGKTPSPSRHDAGVCTLPPKCYSKSCEALTARAPPDARSRTNACLSDTVLEKSYDATTTIKSSSTYETTTATESSSQDKGKKSKFASVLQSIGLLKKNKKTKNDVIEEESETESSTEVNEKRNQKHPFRQDITNYMMHAQELYDRPPSPRSRHERYPAPPCGYGYPPHDCRMHEPLNDRYNPYRERMHAHASAPPYSMRPQASAPPYPYPYDPHCSHNMQQQVPLCLKEIEVKSTGTQSERRLPFFRKLSQKKALTRSSSSRPSRDDHLKTYGTQTVQSKPGLFKSMQSKERKNKFFQPFEFNYNEQKKLALGDTKMRNTLMKKMFYKRNPFSPRNLIVRTLMGNDRSSWGIPPSGMVRRPAMFL